MHTLAHAAISQPDIELPKKVVIQKQIDHHFQLSQRTFSLKELVFELNDTVSDCQLFLRQILGSMQMHATNVYTLL